MAFNRVYFEIKTGSLTVTVPAEEEEDEVFNEEEGFEEAEVDDKEEMQTKEKGVGAERGPVESSKEGRTIWFEDAY